MTRAAPAPTRPPSHAITEAAERYQQWQHRLVQADLWPTEFLVPQLRVPCPRSLPPLMTIHREHLPELRHNALDRLMRRLAPWGYGIQLAPGIVTENHPAALQRMIFRAHLINGALMHLLGTELADCSVVDLACNHGYFALELAHLGARSAIGIDQRPANMERASFLMKHFGITNAAFRNQDVYELGQRKEDFDVVLNLGLLYHVTDPYRLARLSFERCTRLAVFDSLMLKEPVSAYIQRVKPEMAGRSHGPATVELHPTYRAVIDLLYAVGFHTVLEVTPLRGGPNSTAGASHSHYDKQERRCLIAIKGTVPLPDLSMPETSWALQSGDKVASTLPVEVPPRTIAWWEKIITKDPTA